MARYDLSEAEWRLIAPLLPNKRRGLARVDDRRVINGIFYVLRTGSPWRDLPERYGALHDGLQPLQQMGSGPVSGYVSSKPWRRSRLSRCS
jgi:transposase